eukprot:scaffold233665_cov23-Tisochrysis_lutea.AAC.3
MVACSKRSPVGSRQDRRRRAGISNLHRLAHPERTSEGQPPRTTTCKQGRGQSVTPTLGHRTETTLPPHRLRPHHPDDNEPPTGMTPRLDPRVGPDAIAHRCRPRSKPTIACWMVGSFRRLSKGGSFFQSSAKLAIEWEP